MKKLVSLALTLAIFASVSTFAQYGGWGGSTYSNNGGSYPSSSLVRDLCSNGDKSPSTFDGTCGDVLGSGLLVTGPQTKIIKKKRMISFTRLLLNLFR